MRFLGPTFGGINLEDIKAPECFIIEQRLRELMDIPVFHDDQHGTAIIAAAGLINALHLTGRNIQDTKLVVNGAGAAAIACVELIKAMGVPHQNVIMCDTKGVIYEGRTEGMNQWKSAHAIETKARTLAEAMEGADVFFGLSAKGAVTQDMVDAMAEKPIIFAMANPDPEITPEEVKRGAPATPSWPPAAPTTPTRSTTCWASPISSAARSMFAPRTINEEMKIAAAEALAALAREDVPDEVDAAYAGRRLRYGPEYIIPVPFDPRLISRHSPAVAKAAMEIGRGAQADRRYGRLSRRTRRAARSHRRLDAGHLRGGAHQSAARGVRRGRRGKKHPRRGRLLQCRLRHADPAGPRGADSPTRHAPRASRIRWTESRSCRCATVDRVKDYTDMLYARQQRKGLLHRDAFRLIVNRPQLLRRLDGGGGRCRGDGHRAHAQLLPGPSTISAA